MGIFSGILNCPTGFQAASKNLFKFQVFSSYFHLWLPLSCFAKGKGFLGSHLSLEELARL